MAEHNELVGELFLIEKLNTTDRLKHAKKRRLSQLKKWTAYDKQCEKDDNKKQRKSTTTKRPRKGRSPPRIQFDDSITFLEAASRNDIDEVRQLLMKGISPDVANQDGLTALHQCCIDDSEEMLKLLIEFGANLNSQDSELWTPLHAAATCGHIHLCKYLIDNNAELLAVNADGNMPYDICEDERTLDYIESEMAKRAITQENIDNTRLSAERIMLEDLKALAEQGKDLEFRDRQGATPLHIAAANGYLSVAEFLLDHHVSLDSVDNDTWQPIHAAACWGQPVMLELLIENGADVDAKTKNGETPQDICEDPEFKQRISEIKEEMSNHRKMHKTELTRKRSHNTRSLHTSTSSLYSSNTSLSDKNPLSASVRRTSMREKSLMSWKEAREEAKIRVVTPMNGDNNLAVSEVLETLPQSNIDEIRITLDAPENSDDEEDLDDEILDKMESTEISDQNANIETMKSDIEQNHRAVILVSHDEPSRQAVEHKRDSVKSTKDIKSDPVVVESAKDRSSSTKVSVKVGSQSTPSSNRDVVVASSNKTTVSVKGSRETKEEKTLENIKKREEVVMEKKAEKNESQQKVVVRVTSSEEVKKSEQNAPGLSDSVLSDNQSDLSQSSSVTSNLSALRAGNKGTLNDLKKQRAARHHEQLTNSMRLQDSSKLQAELAAMGSPTTGDGSPSNGSPVAQRQNANNGNGVANHEAAPPRQVLYIPPHGPMGTEKRYKFSANNEVIGDDENTNNCCVVM